MGFSTDYQMTVIAHVHTLVKFCHSPVTSDLRDAPAKEQIIFNVSLGESLKLSHRGRRKCLAHLFLLNITQEDVAA